MNHQARTGRLGTAADVRPEDVPRHAGLVVRRMLMRRGIHLKAGDDMPQLIADALLALYQASPPLPRSPLADPGVPGRLPSAPDGGREPSCPPARPPRLRRRLPLPGADCDPLFTEEDAKEGPS